MEDADWTRPPLLCDRVTSEQDAEVGDLFRLCDDYADCLIREVEIGRPDEDYDYLAVEEDWQPAIAPAHKEPLEDDPDEISEATYVRGGPAREVFESFSSEAAGAVIEFTYFDLDYRSEFSEIQETSFAADNPSVLRIHFFREVPEDDQYLHDYVRGVESDSYLGYAIIRSQSPGTLGRCLLRPVGHIQDDKAAATLDSRIRTAVLEYVELFGVQLSVVGVPFMEQDGHLLRCAHVGAWMCHYTAVLRGIVSRKPSAAFHRAEDDAGAYGRRYPSIGLTPSSISRILRKLDLPPAVADDVTFHRTRELSWYDRPEFVDAVHAARRALVVSGQDSYLMESQKSADEEDRLWVEENLSALVCRYLNSGIPCIICRGGHALFVCGYVRGKDLGGTGLADSTSMTSVEALIVNEDSSGPFNLLSLKDLADDICKESSYSSGVSVLVPLPRGLWLAGRVAERDGARLFQRFVLRRLGDYRDGLEISGKDTGETRTKALSQLAEKMQARGSLAIRTYAVGGSDFKRSFADRVDLMAARVCAITRLPKYVWVTEVHDRALRESGEPSVLGTIVLDGSTVSDDSPRKNVVPLLVHLPGEISRIELPDVFDLSRWISTANSEPYRSGRWSHRYTDFLNAQNIAARAKTAG